METKVQLKPETSLFVDALQALLQTEDNVFSGYTSTYGEEQGEKMWYESKAYSLLQDSKREIKLLIGDSLELGLVGALDGVKSQETEGVC